MLPAGAAILLGALERYRLDRLRVAAGGLREGLILAAFHAGPTWRGELPELALGWERSAWVRGGLGRAPDQAATTRAARACRAKVIPAIGRHGRQIDPPERRDLALLVGRGRRAISVQLGWARAARCSRNARTAATVTVASLSAPR